VTCKSSQRFFLGRVVAQRDDDPVLVEPDVTHAHARLLDRETQDLMCAQGAPARSRRRRQVEPTIGVDHGPPAEPDGRSIDPRIAKRAPQFGWRRRRRRETSPRLELVMEPDDQLLQEDETVAKGSGLRQDIRGAGFARERRSHPAMSASIWASTPAPGAARARRSARAARLFATGLQLRRIGSG
jgi:hypothetical protein